MTRPESPLNLLYCSIRAGQGPFEACWIGLFLPSRPNPRPGADPVGVADCESGCGGSPVSPQVPTPGRRPSVFRLCGYFGPTMLQLGSAEGRLTPEATVVPFINQT
jgi:hypothetical protein